MSSQVLLAAGFLLYLTLVAGLTWRAFRRTQNNADFLLGGRRLSLTVTALSAGASDMSAWLLLGLPGLAFFAAYEASWVALGLLCGTYLNWRFIAAPLREQSAIYGDALTIPEFLEHRFNDSSRRLRRLSAACILFFFVFYTAAGLVAGGKLFTSAFGLSYEVAVLSAAFIILTYTAIGGFLAVAWTDALQAALMVVALLLTATLALNEAPSLGSRGERVIELGNVSNLALVSALAWGLGYFGQPHILARFMAISDSTELVRARHLAMTWTTLSLAAAIAIGIGAQAHLDPQVNGFDAETVFIGLVQLFLHPAVAGICLAAILAAIMSTADSQLLTAAAALTYDLKGHSATHRDPLMAHRAAVALIGILATIMALQAQNAVLQLVAYAWAGFGASLGPVVIASLHLKRTSANTAILAVLVGMSSVLLWETRDGGIFDYYSLLPGFVLGCSTIFLCNYLFPRR